jgi:energy-coupling factor transporter ATP-binding protein EcfA2
MADLPFAIAEIHIRDFRGIDDLKMSFCGPDGKTPNELVVIGGPNGTGKTAVLEACLLVTGHEDVLTGSKGKTAIRKGASKFFIDATLMDQGKERRVQYHSGRQEHFLIPCLYFSSRRVLSLVGAVGVTTGPDAVKLPETEENRLGIVKQYLTNARLFELFPTDKPISNGSYQSAIAALNSAWTQFYPGEDFALEPAGSDPTSGFDLFLNSSQVARLPVDQMSSGQLELFVFIASVLTWPANSGLIVIDEPELHLDTDWHRTIVRIIQQLKPRCQLIVATHSPDIYDSATSFERHFLVEEDDVRAKIWENVQKTSVGGAVDAS